MNRKHQSPKPYPRTRDFLSGLLLFFLCVACTEEKSPSELRLEALSGGTYEIYQKEENKLTFSSTLQGLFNQDVTLKSGSYLLLTNCSHKSITLAPGERKVLRLNELNFQSPAEAPSSANWEVQCTAHQELTGERNFNRVFHFNFFEEVAPIKVNQSPVTVLFGKEERGYKKEELSLAGLTIKPQKGVPLAHYFITREGDAEAPTQGESLGAMRLLLPGRYKITLSGSKRSETLKSNEIMILKASSLKVKKPAHFDPERFLKHKGEVYKLFLNENYRIFLEEKIPVFPGTHKLHFEDSRERFTFTLGADERKVLSPNSITVQSNCPEQTSQCFGKKDVFYFTERRNILYQGKSDVPFLFFQEPIGVGFHSSKGLVSWAPAKIPFLKAGSLTLKPKGVYKLGKQSEFARLESSNIKTSGFSRDIKLNKESKLDLIEGDYTFVVYHKQNEEEENSKRKTTYPIKIKGLETTVKTFNFYQKSPPKIVQN